MIKVKNKRRFVEIAFWLFIFLRALAFHTDIMAWHKALFIAIGFVGVCAGIVYLNMLVLIPKLLNRSKYIWYFISVFSLFILSANFFARTDLLLTFEIKVEFYSTKPPLKQLLITKGPEHVKFFVSSLTALFYILISLAYKVLYDFVEKQKEKVLLEREKVQAEMKYLKAQMHPHFFLNALNGLYALARLSPEQTGEYISKLSEMLRYLTYETNKREIALANELKYLKNYIYFQQRKEDRVAVELKEHIEDPSFPIEPMVLIPFIENAFKHGYNPSESTLIRVKVEQKQKILIFECENEIPKEVIFINDLDNKGVGIDNVKQRLALKYKENFKLTYGEEGTVFKVKLILHQN